MHNGVIEPASYIVLCCVVLVELSISALGVFFIAKNEDEQNIYEQSRHNSVQTLDNGVLEEDAEQNVYN